MINKNLLSFGIICLLLSISSLNISAVQKTAPPAKASAASNASGEQELSATATLMSQSSVAGWEKYASKDLFGKKAGPFAFHTNTEENPYIIIKLKNPSELTKVLITNRTDMAQEEAKSLEMYISEDFINWKKVWSANDKTEKVWTVELNKEKARYIRLALAAKNNLVLAKVKIFGFDKK